MTANVILVRLTRGLSSKTPITFWTQMTRQVQTPVSPTDRFYP